MTQLLINSIIAASSYALIALGFSLIYSTVRFFHFAHGIVFTSGAYFTYLFKIQLGFPFWLAIPIALFLCTFLGCLIEFFFYRPLRRKESSSLVFLLASLGIYIVIQNLISLAFGDTSQTFRSGAEGVGIDIIGGSITPVQIYIIGFSLLLIISTALWLRHTNIGKAMRAVANDEVLAKVSGIDSERVMLYTFAMGSALAGIAGILVAFDVDMSPTMGMKALMMGVVTVIVGGVGSVPGIAAGALLLGIAQHFGVWKIGTQWQDAIAFIILLFFLLVRPQGFFGRKVNKATV